MCDVIYGRPLIDVRLVALKALTIADVSLFEWLCRRRRNLLRRFVTQITIKVEWQIDLQLFCVIAKC